MFDITTLLILVAIMTVFVALMLAATYRGKNDRSALYWMNGCLAIAAGLVLVAARPVVSDWLGYAAAITLISGSNLLFGASLRYLADRDAPRNRRAEYTFAVVVLIYCVAQFFGQEEFQHFTALVSMAGAALWAASAARFAARRLKSQQLVVMQYLFVGGALAWGLRLPAAYLFDFRLMGDPALVNTALLLATLAFAVLRHLLYLMVRLSLAYEVTLDRALTRQEQTRQQMLASLNALALARDNETGNHIMRTQHYARRIAQRLRALGHFQEDLDDRRIDLIFDAAPLHDIGKVGIPDHILHKPGPLTDDEWAIMRTHTTLGESVLKAADTDLIDDEDVISVAIRIAGGHHEKWDGSGYPRGLSGESIPLEARIMSLVDMYDALRSARPYKREWTHDEAVTEIMRRKGQFFDPRVVQAFDIEKDAFDRMAREYRD